MNLSWIVCFILFTDTISYKKHRRKKIKIEYEYLPQEYEEHVDTKICKSPTKGGGGGGGGGSSVWGYLTAAVVAANVAANIGKVSSRKIIYHIYIPSDLFSANHGSSCVFLSQ